MRATMATIALKASAIVAALSMSACGGGGGGGTVSPPPPPVYLSSAPGDSAFSAYLQASHQYSLSAVDGAGDTLTVNISTVPTPGTATFDGFSDVDTSVSTVTLEKNGALVTSSVSTDYYMLNPYTALGEVGQSGSPYIILGLSDPIPATLSSSISNSNLNVGIEYHDSTEAVIDGDISNSYYTAVNSATTLLFCINSITSDVSAQGTADGLADGLETDCYSDDASGNIALVSIALTVNGQTVTFK